MLHLEGLLWQCAHAGLRADNNAMHEKSEIQEQAYISDRYSDISFSRFIDVFYFCSFVCVSIYKVCLTWTE